MTSHPTSPLSRLRADLSGHTPATVAVYALCAYVALVSLYNLLLGMFIPRYRRLCLEACSSTASAVSAIAITQAAAW